MSFIYLMFICRNVSVQCTDNNACGTMQGKANNKKKSQNPNQKLWLVYRGNE